MLYGKLPVVFLSTLASEKSGSTNSVIAAYILENIDNMQNVGIRELADKCSVGVGSVSRFCREIGLKDFTELKCLLRESHLKITPYSINEDIDRRNFELSNKIAECIEKVQRSVDMKKITALCEDIRNYENVAVFGMLKAGGVAMNLQNDLAMLGKGSFSKISYQQQMEYINNASEKDLIIIFSYTGVYFDYEYRRLPKSIKSPKIYLITGGENKYSTFINQVISFESSLDYWSHPYQLQYVESLIVQEYSQM